MKPWRFILKFLRLVAEADIVRDTELVLIVQAVTDIVVGALYTILLELNLE